LARAALDETRFHYARPPTSDRAQFTHKHIAMVSCGIEQFCYGAPWNFANSLVEFGTICCRKLGPNNNWHWNVTSSSSYTLPWAVKEI